MKNRIILLTLALNFIVVLSCQKMIEIEVPSSKVTTEMVFQDSTLSLQAMLNVYFTLENYDINFVPYVGLYLGEFNTGSSNALYTSYASNTVYATDGNCLNIWKIFYSVIYQTNSIIDGLTNQPNLTETFKRRLLGESKFLRAYSYLYLCNIYGDVPLLLSTDVYLSTDAKRTNSNTIYEQVISDLTDAKNLLSIYPEEEKVRADKVAANALLARVHLYLRHWDEASKEATEVIQQKNIHELPELTNVFIKNSPETVLQLWDNLGYAPIAVSFIPSTLSSSAPSFILSDQILNSFESGDKRKDSWVTYKIVNSVAYPYATKYKRRSASSTGSSEYTSLLRVSEQFLIRAEAELRLGNLDNSISDLNIIRKRAGLSNLPTDLNQEQIYTSLEAERRSELFAESGHYFFDLKRWGKIDEVISKIKPNWKSYMSLYPVPQSEIGRNPQLTQNPGF